MAAFKAHLTAAVGVSATASLLTATLFELAPRELLLLFGTGVLGGLLPDLDAPSSRPTRLVWTVSATVGAVLLAWGALRLALSFVEAAVLAALGYLLISRLMPALFRRFARHRGVFHSLLAVLFWELLVTNLSYALGASAALAWGLGGFLALGYLTHLVLDEISSIDLRGRRMKRSFGTALKPVGNFWPSLVMVLLSGCLALSRPPLPVSHDDVQLLGERLRGRLVPKLWVIQSYNE